DVDDIFFFASELNLDISCDEELVEALNRNPVPFMMLITGAAYPLTLHKKDEIIFAIGDLDVPSFDLDVLKSYFKIEYAPEVYRLTLEGWGEFPHYATGYYHEGAGQLLLTAMTDRGYSALVAQLNDGGLDLPDDPEVRIHVSMLKTAKDILKKDISLN